MWDLEWVNVASSKGDCLHTRGSTTIPKTRSRMMTSLYRPPTEPEFFRETHTWKRDRSVVEKRTDDLLICFSNLRSYGSIHEFKFTKFSANFEQATQQAQEEGDENVGTVDPNVVWRQTLSEAYRNRVYGTGRFFATSLRTSGYGVSSASAASTYTGLALWRL
ncbi:hypothetical protein PIB30_059618 [Stylosanthes scabra]|uniref:Uncharacterized protein n=1 Tax=Stylosanthes scabra TaxID=79078 RepID=A0ABU6RL48_9FABA|nr:hypothetical protein [Stylosanthes scabra]